MKETPIPCAPLTRPTCWIFLLLVAGVLTAGPVRCGARQQWPGFGSDTPGGRGGQVLRVANLNAKGPGSLRAALESKGPRIIVFEVAGVIDLEQSSLKIAEPFVTVAGQTAPSPGITIIRGGISIQSHDVIIQHLHIRPGDAGRAKRSGWEADGMSTSGGEAYNVLVDHCSVTWATDENLSVSGPRLEGPAATSHRVTIRNCLIAECLHNATHGKGPHSKGSLIHDFCQDVAIIGNLYAHNHQRNPYFKAHTTGVIVNNVIYNPGNMAVQLGFAASEWKGARYEPVPPRVSVVGNVYLPGVSTRPGLAMIERPGYVYQSDNLALEFAGKTPSVVGAGVELLDQKPVWPPGLTPLPATEVLDHIARHVGARPRDRDAIDRRIIQDLIQRQGRILDSQDEVGGYPQVAPVHRPLDVPQQEVDQWLAHLAAALE